MGISDKIDDIRKKPENIRLLYVWFFVAVFMVFVVILWFFSLINSRNSQEAATENQILNSDIMNQFTNQAKDLQKMQNSAGIQPNALYQSNNSSQNIGNENQQIPQ